MLFNWSLNSADNARVSSGSASELLENGTGVALVALEAGVEPVWPILPLEVVAGVFAIDCLFANAWITVVCICEAHETLVWNIVWLVENFLLDEAVGLTVSSSVLGVVDPDDGTHVAETHVFGYALGRFLECLFL